jgi:enoyl-CoA hydratase
VEQVPYIARGEAPVVAWREDNILHLELNRPHRLNAVSEDLYECLLASLRTAPEDGVRVILITGRGRAFCAGADMKAHAKGRTAAEQAEYIRLGTETFERLQTISVPVVAAVHGYALGAGAELALSCDVVVISEKAQIGFPEASLGTYVGGAVTWRLPRAVGLARATDLLMLSCQITGREAARYGLVAKAVAEERLADVAQHYAERLARQAPITLRHLKRDLRESATRTALDALDAEQAALGDCMRSEDWIEGIQASRDGRAPVYKGR